MARHVVDLSRESSLCGDPAAHVARLLRRAAPGDTIVVRTRLPLEEVKESLELLEATGRVRLVEERELENGVVEVVLRVEG